MGTRPQPFPEEPVTSLTHRPDAVPEQGRLQSVAIAPSTTALGSAGSPQAGAQPAPDAGSRLGDAAPQHAVAGSPLGDAAPQHTEPGSQLGDAVLSAGRVLAALAERSLREVAGEVTLPQHRVLSELAERGPQRVADLADVLSVDRSTATRMCDRLVRKGLVHRRRLQDDRRGVRIALAPEGRRLVETVATQRREQVREIVRRMPDCDRQAAVDALGAFVATAGDAPQQSWSLGWRLP